jgi:general secretion pathway protein G
MTTEQRQKRRQAAGFTLVELMVVIAIIAVLAGVVGFNVLGALGQGNQTAAKAQIKSLKDAVIGYKIKNRKLPDSLDQVAPFLDASKVPADPWGNPFLYEKKGSSEFVIMSYGGDGAPGGEEEDADISSAAMHED